MTNKPPRTVYDWINELESGDPARRQPAIVALSVLAPTSQRAAAALQAAGVSDPNAVRQLAAKSYSRADASERSAARRLYALSLLSPLVVLFGFCLGPSVLLYPIVMLIILIAGLTSKARFVFWHTLQWLVLTVPIALIFGLDWLLQGFSLGFGMWLLVGIVWYALMIAGLSQAGNGHCWLWKIFVPLAELPRPWAGAAHIASDAATDARAVVAGLLEKFRNGNPAERQTALQQLEVLGEVEQF